MPQLALNPERYELERLEEREARDREDALLAAEREHSYRIAKLKYSTAARHRTWARVLVAFAKAPTWAVLAFTARRELPEHWRKFLEL